MPRELSSNEIRPAPEETANELSPVDLAPEDFYLEGPYLIFTAAFHRKRGYCCNSNCRHCPFK